jgi:peptidoglycan hydrolase CwlO-like protein
MNEESMEFRLAKEADERHEKLKEQIAKLRTEKEADKGQMDQLRVMNRELEAQFNTQMDMIGALKRKLLMMTVGGEGEGDN